jgi:hypothetical protein
MNLGFTSTWKNTRSRNVIGVGGVALALGIAIGGISTPTNLAGREVPIAPQYQSQAGSLVPTEASAALEQATYVGVTMPQSQAPLAVDSVTSQVASALEEATYVGVTMPQTRAP